jgi:hypothetical protein
MKSLTGKSEERLTTSIEDRMGAPMFDSRTPYEESTSFCPSAVAPPWLPMAGTTNGLAFFRLKHLTVV